MDKRSAKIMAIGCLCCGSGILLGALWSASLLMLSVAPAFLGSGVLFFLKTR